MDQILDSPEIENRIMPYAGFWIRVAAYLIDGVLLWVVNVAFSFLYRGSYSFYNSELLLDVVSIATGVLYFTLMESSERQATLGKMALSLKVGDKYGNRISFGNALGRYLSKIISGIILGIGFMMVGWDEKKQGLHDKIADTYVYEN